jgi:hypothetical protein
MRKRLIFGPTGRVGTESCLVTELAGSLIEISLLDACWLKFYRSRIAFARFNPHTQCRR